MNRLARYRFRFLPTSAGLFRELADEIRDQSGPTSLVRGATATAIVAVEVFMEQDVVLEMRIGLKFLIGTEHRTPAVGPAHKQLEQSAAQFNRDLVQGQHDAGAGRTLDLQAVA